MLDIDTLNVAVYSGVAAAVGLVLVIWFYVVFFGR